MTGVRAYSLIDVLKQLNDQSVPTVPTAQNELGAILVGNQTVQETMAMTDTGVTITLAAASSYVWGPSGGFTWGLAQWA